MQNFQRRMRNYLIAIVMLAAMACIMASMSGIVYQQQKAGQPITIQEGE